MTRLLDAWRAMDSERRFAALASLGLFISMFLPWYQQNGVVRAGSLESRNLDAFQVFSFVEAAVLLVALALLYMLYARADGRDFRVPFGDGTIILVAGVWVGVLLIFRLFDKPGVSSHGVAANVGVQWGIFFALAAAGLIAWSGSRMRGATLGPRLRPTGHASAERRSRRAQEEARTAPSGARDTPREPLTGPTEPLTGQTEPLSGPTEPPTGETRRLTGPTEPVTGATEPLTGETQPLSAATPAGRRPAATPAGHPAAGRPAAATPAGARRRPRFPPAPGEPEQLSFEDAAGHDEGP